MNLDSSVAELPLVGPVYQKRLEKLGISTIRNLIYHVPSKYNDFSYSPGIAATQIGDTVTIHGTLNSLKNQYTKSGKRIQIGEVEDTSGQITVVWFNQAFLTRTLYPGTELSLAGEIGWFGAKKALISPEYEITRLGAETVHTGKIVPVYPETEGVSSKWLRTKVKQAYQICGNQIKEYLPQTYGFVGLPEALRSVHFPPSLAAAAVGRRRLAFDELFHLQAESLKRKREWQKNKAAYRLVINKLEISNFIKSLPFTPTKSQKTAVEEILTDLQKPYPMNRLLEGDVGSGKTMVAAIAAFAAFANGYQSVIMAPTQILSRQHFNTLNNLLQPFKVSVSLITAGDRKPKAVGSDVYIGTHALIHQKLDLDKVALVVIDEQQKFGVEQREHLVKKALRRNIAPHILTMTATPIPRTVALTFYGDLDLSTLTEIPGGRPKVTTWIVPLEKREKAYRWIQQQITNNLSQAFVVCPLIEESEKETMKDVRNVTTEFQMLKKQMSNIKFGLLHGRLKADEKEKVVKDFRDRKIDILVTTPVIEVGIDIPNAAIIVVEAAERFGLAQLHQLRGRVGRGQEKSYCLLFAEAEGEKPQARLKAMRQNLSGFELAELDLNLRGPGEIFGFKQHGIPDLKIASWTDIDLIKKARSVVQLSHDTFT